MITAHDYKQRRQQFMSKMPPRSVAIFQSAPPRLRNGDTHYPYRQESDFYYLSGFSEPDASMLLLPSTGKTLLFCQPHDVVKELWDGPRVGQDGAIQDYSMDDAFDKKYFIPRLEEELHAGIDSIYYPMNRCVELGKQLRRIMVKAQKIQRHGRAETPWNIVNSDHILHEMRLYKSNQEVELLQKAVDITIIAHKNAMQQCQPGVKEYQLEATLLHAFYYHGSRSPAYGSIVAGGKNSCILHYVNNQAELKTNELVLIDAGAEYQGYAADITRTFPVNGHYRGEQKAIYELVLAAQLAAIEQVMVGNPYNNINQTAVNIVTQGLVDLGLLQGDVQGLIESNAYQTFYPHRAGHWLGLDVHDVGAYQIDQHWRALEAGMVLTVEPGIYIRPADHIDEKWWNIGIRIEDDVLVTPTSARVLSQALPKTVIDIEHWMKGGAT
jgi:Xaa-Pro aminopeptidase